MNVFRTLKMAAIAAVAGVAMLGATVTANAMPIVGTISIFGFVNDPSDTTGIDFIGDGTVLGATGSFSGLVGATATLTDVDFSSLPGTVWTAGAFSFTLESIIGAIESASDGISFDAMGTLSAAGFDDTSGIFSFSSNEIGSTGQGTFSAATAVPLPASVLLLGGALIGAGAISRRRKNAA
ncbi:VPLPA-CTERM sorting domain-containing protein [uncultured Roseibium sp.]|uniref:VPLPA-CTERM sorting domain-containing protein n=1 Tax=uncultured Roseibium sp. TaxID=1936171 RepID=UPI002613A14E|nr:VPLPA-CTERM sorting domain-containing protein [uncultured Roseibium sp.]